ncbi:MAG TPA: HlyD family efflux transporter periplasmic adaptor subunit [Candidatus Acidoferrum sp.]|nr:HlyD family efflux transporter periplasmic adaptor subunit [Candidatus Acidoferrum sp.]
MRFGPTSLRVSSVLAKGLRRPKLRQDLRISEQTVAGETSYVIKVEETSSYNRYGAQEFALLQLCDGTRTPAEIATEINRENPDINLGETEVLDFLDSVEPAMWEQSIGEKNLAVLERIRDERKSRIDQSSVLYISFKAWDPDKTLAKLDPYVGWIFYSKGFVVFSILIFIVVCYLLAGDWTRVQQDTASLYSFADKSAYDIWAFWILLLLLGAVHEFGHGLTCKHYGGDVHQMGFLLIYFTPAFYTDTTDILLFKRGRERQLVIFAGIWIELVFCGVCALIWHFSLPGTVVNDLAYKGMLLSGVQGALLNLNPLIKADGYYALSQYLEIDNLREESFAFLRAWFAKYILHRDMDLPASSRRQRRIFAIFGITAILYSVTLILISLIFVRNILVSKFGDWGYLLTLGVVYFFARKSVRMHWPAVRAWLREKKEELMAWKMTRAQQAGALGVLALLLIPPVPSRVNSDFVLEPGREAAARAAVSGTVRQVFVHQGDVVKAGQVLAVLDSAQADADVAALQARLALVDSQLRVGESHADLDQAARALPQRQELAEDLAVAQLRASETEIRAPIDGVVTTPLVSQMTGQYLSGGEEICMIADREQMRAHILVRDWALEDVKQGAVVRLKVLPFPFRTYRGEVLRIMPAASPDRPVAHPEKLERLGQELTNYFAVEVAISNPDGSLREGMTGTAKIGAKDYPIGYQIGRSSWRWVRSQFW